MGAVFVVILPELLRFVSFPDSIAANLRQIVYGLLLVILMRIRPQGLVGEYKTRRLHVTVCKFHVLCSQNATCNPQPGIY